MLDLIKYIVNQFAENADEVEYKVVENGNNVDVTVLLKESDMGKVIGRQGKIAKSLRTIVSAASKKSGKRYNIEIKGKDEE
ncbi:MAG: KH domain-containing protein [Clostridia bacterium]|nr:KH domain-containing protein [Clostridia bacterium]